MKNISPRGNAWMTWEQAGLVRSFVAAGVSALRREREWAKIEPDGVAASHACGIKTGWLMAARALARSYRLDFELAQCRMSGGAS